MGGDPPSTNESTASMLDAYKNYFPQLMAEVNKSLPEAAQAQLAADQLTSPEYAKMNQELYAKYGPEMNKIGADIAAQNQAAQSASDLAIARGTGKELVSEADALQRMLDPEYYAQREALGGAIGKYLGSQDPTQLTPNEREEALRGMAATGVKNPNSSMDTVKNAMTFGSALQAKQNNFGNAIANAGNALTGLKSGQSGIGIATGKTPTTNTGEARTTGASTNAGSNAINIGTDFLNQIGNTQRTSIGAQESNTKKVQQVLSWL